MSLAAELWTANADLAEACRDGAFVTGLGDGSLDREAFRRYVAQDAFFLDAFLRAYALAAARATDDPAHVRTFHDLMGGVLEELELHAAYAAELDIDLAAVQPLAATRAYTDFLLRTAWHDGLPETLAAMTPCMRLYAWLGRELEPALRDGHPYAKWITTYASDDFEGLAGLLERLTDEVATDSLRVRNQYRRAMVLEREFFEAPLDPAAR